MKFYDNGFIDVYPNYVDLQIFNSGNLALHLMVYKDKVCQTTFRCMSAKQFNDTYLSSIYDDHFLYNLLNKNRIYFKDKKNHIFIKVK